MAHLALLWHDAVCWHSVPYSIRQDTSAYGCRELVIVVIWWSAGVVYKCTVGVVVCAYVRYETLGDRELPRNLS